MTAYRHISSTPHRRQRRMGRLVTLLGLWTLLGGLLGWQTHAWYATPSLACQQLDAYLSAGQEAHRALMRQPQEMR